MSSTGSTPSFPVRVAVVGCGAVTKASLLPVLAGHEGIAVSALVDRDLRRGRALADAYRIEVALDDMAALSRDTTDAVVLATPPAHHAPATLDLIARGFHVMVEKPMANRAADAEAMVRAADQAGVVLAVGLYRRLLPVSRLLRGLLDAEMLGRPLDVDIEEGGEYSWELATLSVLTREGGGGGVLIDIGTHLLDQLFFVLPGGASVVGYADNARGGIETDCELHLSLATRWGALPVRMELSRTRQLRGSVRVRCERGFFELDRGEFCRLRIHAEPARVVDATSGADRAVVVEALWADEREVIGYKAFRAEFDDWLSAIAGRRDPHLSGRSVVPVVRVVEDAYRAPARLAEPWVDGGLLQTSVPNQAPAVVSGVKPRVLVTGAGGFLGCRTVECLHLGGAWDVRALVRRPGSAARLARFPLDIVLGDVTSKADLKRALDGCDAVVHCAVGTGWPPEAAFKVTVEGTRVVAEAALEAGVRRLVHISSMAVHGDRAPARLDESQPLQPGSGVTYTRAKCLAEDAIARARRQGLAVVTLRPTRIYGPFSKTFTVRPLIALARGALVLAGDADSPANMVYVDNVVHAILRALDAGADLNGEAFLVSDPDQRSWREFFDWFAAPPDRRVRVAPYPATPQDSTPGLAGRWVGALSSVVRSSEFRGLGKKVLATDPLASWPRRWLERSPGVQSRLLRALGADEAVIYRAPQAAAPETVVFRIDPTVVSLEKSARLGYAPPVSQADGLRLTGHWARYARLIPAPE